MKGPASVRPFCGCHFLSRLNRKSIVLFPFILLADDGVDPLEFNRAAITVRQQAETYVVGYFLILSVDFLFGLVGYLSVARAKRSVRFWRERLHFEAMLDYPSKRLPFAWKKFS